MQTVTTVAALRQQITAWQKRGEKIIFVPTMGNLHAGHLALVKHAKAFSGKIICSIFVNALQFDREEDLQAYPRTLQQDIAALEHGLVDVVFIPEYEEIYSVENQITVPKIPLNQQLCGTFRPGFFDGIVEVVTRMFVVVTPDIAVFGEKDYQQLVIIKQLVAGLGLPIQIEQVPTQRAKDGLALSSRNSYLNDTERILAPQLYAVLAGLKKQIEKGSRDYIALQEQAMQQLTKVGFRPDYVAIRTAEDLGEVCYDTDFIIILAAAWLGKARLIDNVLLQIT